tara:strand:+ start:1079 stop:1639 length:561 start_codon:yes stop_codon:yes gene_type:complete
MTKEKVIYLTFDDGPIPVVTDFVLDEMAKVGGRATFFCVGENIVNYPVVYERILKEGHRSANHTYNHLNGSKTTASDYFKNVEKCSLVVRDDFGGKELFRPPYGRLTSKQFKLLAGNYQVVMWDVLSGDFDKSLSKEDCLKNTIRYSDRGSIVVFHDSVKTIDKLSWVLPRYLSHFYNLGYSFECL